LEKLQALDNAEQKLKDAQWLSPDEDQGRFGAGLGEIERSRKRTLEEAFPAVERLLEAAGKGVVDLAELLRAAGQLLSFLNHYRPDDPRIEALTGKLLQSGGKQPPYEPVRPLAEMYDRSGGVTGCGLLLVLLFLGMIAGILAVYSLR
ncbi:MAG: hypothetical protein MUQ65_10275, partial [Armatimonadetes bacterium]|nr:hypothetical protein [Armatimonadota bacterium]